MGSACCVGGGGGGGVHRLVSAEVGSMMCVCLRRGDSRARAGRLNWSFLRRGGEDVFSEGGGRGDVTRMENAVGR